MGTPTNRANPSFGGNRLSFAPPPQQQVNPLMEALLGKALGPPPEKPLTGIAPNNPAPLMAALQPPEVSRGFRAGPPPAPENLNPVTEPAQFSAMTEPPPSPVNAMTSLKATPRPNPQEEQQRRKIGMY